MSTKTLNTAIEKIAPTAILKLDGPFNDFQAKEIIEIIDDLLDQDFVHFIINFNQCIEVNNYGVSVLISLIGSINAKTPFIIPIELPKRNEASKIIRSSEYLRHGFTAQFSSRSNAKQELWCNLVN